MPVTWTSPIADTMLILNAKLTQSIINHISLEDRQNKFHAFVNCSLYPKRVLT